MVGRSVFLVGPVGQVNGRSVGTVLFGRSVGRSVFWSVGRSFGRSVGLLVGRSLWSVGLVGRSVGRSVGLPG